MQLPVDFAFSQNSLQDYADCPRRFELRYLKHLSWPAIEAEPVVEHERQMRVGSLFHKMVHQHMLGVPLTQIGRMAGDPDLQMFWENYTRFLPGNLEGRRYPEITLSMALGEHALVAKYDLVVISPTGQATILDWKTGDRLPKLASLQRRIQTRVYRYVLLHAGAALNEGRPISADQITFAYWYAGFPEETFHIRYSDALAKEDETILEGLVAEIISRKEDDFPLTEDVRKCRFCVYRSYCERGETAGNLASLGEEDELVETAAIFFDFDQIAEIEF